MDPVAYLVDDGRNMAAFTNRDSAAEYAVDMQRWNGGVIPRLVPLVEASKLSAALRRERKLRRAVLAWAGHAWVLSGASGKDALGIRLMARARDGVGGSAQVSEGNDT